MKRKQARDVMECMLVSREQIAALMVRYWGIGPELSSDEREILLFALESENKALGGSIHRDAAAMLKKRGQSRSD